MKNGEFPCPKGCERGFKTNSAAHAHAVHCKHKTEVTPEVTPEVNPGGNDLSPSEQAIVDRVTDVILPQISILMFWFFAVKAKVRKQEANLVNT